MKGKCMEFPSKVLEKAVEELSQLPGIGKKTALRLALHVLRGSVESAEILGNAIVSLRKDVQYCQTCGNLSDEPICSICSSPRRHNGLICVVEDCKDVIAIENTGQFNGTYHVLGGVIHPLAGIGPSDLNIERLIQRIEEEECKELIFALSSSMEGETTAFYISRKLQPFGLKISSIARGIPVGSELEFADEVTLARSLIHRTAFQVNTESNGI